MRKVVKPAVGTRLFAVPGSEDGEDRFSQLHVSGLWERRGRLAFVCVKMQTREITKRREIELALFGIASQLLEICIEMS